MARRTGGRGWFGLTAGRAAAALLAGALPCLAFPAPSLWWLAYAALVPWLLLVRTAPTSRRAACEGWLGGLGYMLAVHHWLLPSLNVFTVVLAALLGVLWAPWGVLVRQLLGGVPPPGRAVAALVVLPAGWLLIELARSWQGLGGPWGLLGSSQWQVAPALRLASVGGVWLVSLLVVAVNVAAVLLISAGPPRVSAVVALVLVAVAAGAVWQWAPRPQPTGQARIAVVQPGVVAGPHSTARRLALEEQLTRRLARQDVDLVVWGESGVSADPSRRPELAARLARLSAAVGAELLVNVDARQAPLTGEPGGRAVFKRAVLVDGRGLTGARYDKMRLVPFGEYVPARSLLGWATSVGRAAGEDRGRGTRQVLMDAGHGLRVGPLICFESAFPDMGRQLAADGAGVLVVQSSTSSFQHSWAPEQHASLAALRAAETGRPVVHATLTGVSAVFGPGGERTGPVLGTGSRAAAVYSVPLASGTTPYVRFGDWAVHGSLLVLALFFTVRGVRSFNRPALAPLPPEPLARTVRGWPGRRGH
ncbi:apolipoprotein N-acyltransferase [Streptomyces sp. NPDC058045]|uniref:apolipoprotein N-acyltransferase n=1 Tax=Streptomyces sp. NPDC058045 TaxID=3346311 RepID=UPI0036E7DB25